MTGVAPWAHGGGQGYALLVSPRPVGDNKRLAMSTSDRHRPFRLSAPRGQGASLNALCGAFLSISLSLLCCSVSKCRITKDYALSVGGN